MQKILTEWRKYLTEQRGTGAKYGASPKVFVEAAEKARQHVLNLLPDVNKENQYRTANLLGAFFNPRLPKAKGSADVPDTQTADVGAEGPLTKKELLAFAISLGQLQREWIEKMPIYMLNTQSWRIFIEYVTGSGGGSTINLATARGMYDTGPVGKIYINVNVFGDDEQGLYSAITHELWHATDHAEVRGPQFLEDVKIIPEAKKAAIRKIISRNFRPAEEGGFEQLRGHAPTGIMTVINRANFDEFFTTKTYIKGVDPKAASVGAGLKAAKAALEGDDKELSRFLKYLEQGTERQVRLKHLIDAIRQVNHPKSLVATPGEVVDFCLNRDKYSSIHRDIPATWQVAACKRIDTWQKSEEAAKITAAMGDCLAATWRGTSGPYAMGWRQRKKCRREAEAAKKKAFVWLAQDGAVVLNRVAKVDFSGRGGQQKPWAGPGPEERGEA